MMTSRNWLIITLLMMSLVHQSMGGCKFPPHVNMIPGWHYIDGVSQESLNVNVYGPEFKVLTFYNSNLNYNYTCEIEYISQSETKPGTHYIVLDSSVNEARCIRFVDRSATVIQIEKSEKTEKSPLLAEVLCDTSMVLDPWLLVTREQLPNEGVMCPITGGHTVELFNKNGNRIPCDQRRQPPRIENGCLHAKYNGPSVKILGTPNMTNKDVPIPHLDSTGKYLTLDLEHCAFDNHEQYPMTMANHYRCIATWTDSGFNYTVIATDSHDKVWTLRQHNNGILLFVHAIASKGDSYSLESNNLIKMDVMQTHVEETLCIDANPQCKGGYWDCKTSNSHYCQLSCKHCNASLTCAFSSTLSGTWKHAEQGQFDMGFNGSEVDVAGKTVFRCQQEEDMRNLGDLYTLFDVTENGCYPNVHCVLLRQISPSVVIYNGLKSESWPDRWTSNSCASASHDVLGWKVLYAKGEKSTVSCGLNDKVKFSVTHSASSKSPGVRCKGEIYREKCDDTSLLTIEHKECSNKVDTKHQYNCLGSISHHNVTLLLLIDSKNFSKLSCLKEDHNNPSMPLTIMPAKYCSPDYALFNVSTMAEYLYGEVTKADDGCKDVDQTPNVMVNKIGQNITVHVNSKNSASSRVDSKRSGLILAGLLTAYYHLMGFNYRLSTLFVISIHLILFFTLLEMNCI